MAMEDNESRASGVQETSSSPAQNRQQRQKLEVYNEVLRRLKDSNNEEAMQPGFHHQLWAHFNRLPTRYALDVNVERAADVLMHKRLLHLAHDPANRPAIEVRLVQCKRKPVLNRYSAFTLEYVAKLHLQSNAISFLADHVQKWVSDGHCI